MIARTWRGTVHRADAEEYATYISATGFADYGQTPGNRGAWMLRRDERDRTEFITLSLWESVDAIRAFAGDDMEAAVLYRRMRATSSANRRSPTTRSSTKSSPPPGQAREPRARSRRAACTGPACMRWRREPPGPSRTPCRRAALTPSVSGG
jgi:heme-degrading monooxygenase HmoA